MVKTKPIKPKEKRTIVSNLKKERDQFKKEKDMIKLKQKINELLRKVSDDKNILNNKYYQRNNEIIFDNNEHVLYKTMLLNYMNKEFSLKCLSFINIISIKIKNNKLKIYEGKYNFNKIFVSLAKTLFLNEFELVLLSLYLDYSNISFVLDDLVEESLLFLGFYIKNLTLNNDELKPINSYLNHEYKNFSQNYEKWYKTNEKILNKSKFTLIEINKRFKEYNSPYNSYCSNNFIDFNCIVDRILTMSLPYVNFKKGKNHSSITEESIISNANEEKKGNISFNITNIDNSINKNETKINKNSIDNNNLNEMNKKQNFKNHKNIKGKKDPFIIDINMSSNENDNNNKMNENKDVNEGNLPKNKITRFTPNNLLHSLGNTNKFQGNN